VKKLVAGTYKSRDDSVLKDQAMPNRRRKKKGSFGSHFDELVTVFPDKPRRPQTNDSAREHSEADDRHINDKLFEAAWRKAREQRLRP